MSRPTPPAWARGLLEAAAPKGPERDAILGDFEEELFDLSSCAGGRRLARAWYARQVLRSCGPLLALRLRRSLDRPGLTAMAVGWVAMLAGFVTVAGVSALFDALGADGIARQFVIFVLAMVTPVAAGAAGGFVLRGRDPFAAYAFAFPASLTIAGVLLLSTEQESTAAWLVWMSVVTVGVLVGTRWSTALFPPGTSGQFPETPNPSGGASR